MKNQLQKEINAAAESYLTTPEIPVLPMTGYQDYLDTGNRIHFEKAYFERRRQLAVLGLADKTPPVLQQLEQVIWEVCNEYTWALPAHLPIADEQFTLASETWLDLFSAETGQALAEIYETNYAELSPIIKERIKVEINRRIFQPFLAQPWDWELKENNWSSVVGGSIGMAALSLLPKNSHKLQKIISRLKTAMNSYLSGFGDDGVCMEGVGYWGYGFGYYIYYAEKLAEKTGNAELLEKAKVREIAAFPYFAQIKGNHYVPFADYTTSFLPTGLLTFCHDYFGVAVPEFSKQSALDDDHCYRFAHLSRNLRWQASGKMSDSTSFSRYFPDSQWFISKNLENDCYFAAKGGRNDESHNQLDIGNFIFGTMDEMFLTDLGAGEYTKNYFDDDYRYQIKPNDTLSHSLPEINGTVERSGAYQAHFIQERPELVFELASLYQNDSLLSFQRSYQNKENELTVIDTFDFSAEENTIKENFVTSYLPRVEKNVVRLVGEKSYCQLTFPTENILVIEESFSNHAGEEEIFYRILVEYQNVEKNFVVENHFEIFPK